MLLFNQDVDDQEVSFYAGASSKDQDSNPSSIKDDEEFSSQISKISLTDLSSLKQLRNSQRAGSRPGSKSEIELESAKSNRTNFDPLLLAGLM